MFLDFKSFPLYLSIGFPIPVRYELIMPFMRAITHTLNDET